MSTSSNWCINRLHDSHFDKDSEKEGLYFDIIIMKYDFIRVTSKIVKYTNKKETNKI